MQGLVLTNNKEFVGDVKDWERSERVVVDLKMVAILNVRKKDNHSSAKWDFKWKAGFKRIGKFRLKQTKYTNKEKEEAHEDVRETVEGAVRSAQILRDYSKMKEEHTPKTSLRALFIED